MKTALNRFKSILTKPLFLFFLNPLLFIGIGIFMALFFNPISNFTVLVYPPTDEDTISYPTGELLKGKKIRGEFTARDNNLGIVSVRFYNFQRISTDSVRFRLSEKESSTWYYQNDYTVAQFQPNQYFTFGFPVIPDSQGKRYVFEVESLDGKKGNAIGRSEITPYFITHYQFPKYQIFSNGERLMNYIFEKRINSIIENPEAIIGILVYFLPLTYYAYIVLFLTKLRDKNIILPIIIVGLLSFLEVILLPGYRTDLMLFIGLLWWITFYYKRIDGTYLILFSLCLILFIPFLNITNFEVIANKLARWMYILLIMGVAMKLIEKRRPKRVAYKGLLHDE